MITAALLPPTPTPTHTDVMRPWRNKGRKGWKVRPHGDGVMDRPGAGCWDWIIDKAEPAALGT